MKTHQSPPKLAEWLLERLFPDNGNCTAAGDFAEVYSDIAVHEGPFRAWCWYWAKLFRAIPSFFNNLMYWSLVMLKSYFVIAFRNLIKNRKFAVINILGLSLAIGCAIVAFLFVEQFYDRDTFHENAENIFLVENVIERNGRKQIWGDSPMPVGQALKNDYPQIQRVVRINYGRGTMRSGDKVFDERMWYADPELFEMFTFPLKYGNKNALHDKSAMVITEDLAVKYFGDENPIDKQVTLTFDDGQTVTYFIKGVTEKVPFNSSIRFTVIVNFDNQFAVSKKDVNNWKEYTGATFVQVNHPSDIQEIEKGMDKYVALQNAANIEWPVADLLFDNLLNLSLNSYRVRGDISGGSPPAGRYALGICALCIMLLACFNYMNIAIASAAKRFKEIGIRKVIGGRKMQLILQFLGENLLTCLIAMSIGLALSYYLLIPEFNEIFPMNIALDFNEKPIIWLFLLGLLVFTGVIAGMYPAVYVSRFQPVSILRKEQKLGGKNRFTRVLITFQFILSFAMIVLGVVFKQNFDYQRGLDWGYNQEAMITVPLDGKQHYELYKNAISQHPNIVDITAGWNHIGRSSHLTVVEYAAQNYEIRQFAVDHNYLEAMGVRLKAGRTFDENLETDDKSIIVNEKFVAEIDWGEPLESEGVLGKQVVFDSTTYNIVGVVEDFHHQNFFREINPSMFRVTKPENFYFLAVRAKPGTVIQTSDFLKETWQKLIPAQEYKAFFQDEVFGDIFQEGENVRKMGYFIAFTALVISCMGLFGIVSLALARRLKEISIRKVLGATIGHINGLINKEFIFMLVIAVVLSTPLSFFLTSKLLDSIYKYRVPLESGPFIFAAVLLIATALLTVLSQVYKTASSNPVDALRNE